MQPSGNNSQLASSSALDRSQSPFLASLPWFTNAILKPDLVPACIADTFGVSRFCLAVPQHPANDIQLFTNKVKRTEEEVTRNHEDILVGGVKQFNHYFCSFMGIGVPIKQYGDFQHRKFFAKAANIMMMYRLCDIMTWTLCPDDQGIVPQ